MVLKIIKGKQRKNFFASAAMNILMVKLRVTTGRLFQNVRLSEILRKKFQIKQYS